MIKKSLISSSISDNFSLKNRLLKKHEEIEKSTNEIELIIQNELYEYLENIPDKIVNNLSKEIKNKIHDKLFEFNQKLEKKIKKILGKLKRIFLLTKRK